MNQNIYSEKQSAIILQVIILLIGGFLIYAMWPYQAGIVGALILYAIVKNWYMSNVKKKKRNKMLYISGILLVSFVIIIIPILTFSIMLANKIIYYTGNYEELVQLAREVQTMLPIEIFTPDVVKNFLQTGGQFVSSLFSSLVDEASHIVINISMMYVLLFFMLYKQDEFHAALYRYVPLAKSDIDRLRDQFRLSVDAYVTGQGIISLIQAFLLGVGFWLFGYPDALFWGLVGFFFSFIPVVGTPIIWIPAGLLGIISENDYNGWGMLIWGSFLVTNIDNVLRFVLAKKMGDIPPLITILGVLIGIPYFGLMGLIVGPLIIIYFLILIDIYVKNKPHLRTDLSNEFEE